MHNEHGNVLSHCLSLSLPLLLNCVDSLKPRYENDREINWKIVWQISNTNLNATLRKTLANSISIESLIIVFIDIDSWLIGIKHFRQ